MPAGVRIHDKSWSYIFRLCPSLSAATIVCLWGLGISLDRLVSE